MFLNYSYFSPCDLNSGSETILSYICLVLRETWSAQSICHTMPSRVKRVITHIIVCGDDHSSVKDELTSGRIILIAIIMYEANWPGHLANRLDGVLVWGLIDHRGAKRLLGETSVLRSPDTHKESQIHKPRLQSPTQAPGQPAGGHVY